MGIGLGWGMGDGLQAAKSRHDRTLSWQSITIIIVAAAKDVTMLSPFDMSMI